MIQKSWYIARMKHLNKDTLKITAEDIAEFLQGKRARAAKSKLYKYGQRVTPTDTRRKLGRHEYLFVSSMRWTPYGDSGYGGFILFNPRTAKLVSVSGIKLLD